MIRIKLTSVYVDDTCGNLVQLAHGWPDGTGRCLPVPSGGGARG